jgi:F-type H+-transporting ATPase subunit b
LELNWSTFLLEIFNFLVLIWILKRFLYQPVLDVIARRRSMIENQLAEAGQLHDDSDALKQKYVHSLSDWEQERQMAMDKLMHELEETRQQQLAKLKSEIAQEEEKISVVRSRQNKQALLAIEQQALQQGAEFASHLLAMTSGPELETRLFDLLLSDLAALSSAQISELSNKWGEPPEYIQVTSAYPLSDEQQHRLEDALERVASSISTVKYEQDASLLAGLNITIGAWVLQLNIRDELQGFVELSHAED